MGCIGFIVYRFNSLFNVSKTRALVVTILCFLAGCPLMIAHLLDNSTANLAWFAFGGAFWGYAFIYGCIFTFKFCRDMDALIKAEQDYYNPLPPAVSQRVEQPMTSPSSSHQFVPSPLDRP